MREVVASLRNIKLEGCACQLCRDKPHDGITGMPLPDWIGDRNAAIDLLRDLSATELARFARTLATVVTGVGPQVHGSVDWGVAALMVRADASQITEAYIKTRDRWED